jgi:SAM-dependent methyltransferase
LRTLDSEFAAHQQAKQLFDRTADKYFRRSSGSVYNFTSLIFRRRIAIVESSIRRLAKPGGNALDYGMGPAVFAECCEAAGMHYLGIDVSPEMVERSKQLGFSNSEFIVGDLETLNAYKNQKDLVLAIGLIDYLEDVPAGISQLAACVKPGGNLILSFRNRYSLPGLLRDISKTILRPFVKGSSRADDKAFFAKVHEKSFDPKSQLVPQLASLGFSGFEVHYFNCSPFFFNFPLPKFLWRTWYAVDRTMAHRFTRFVCSGGVVAGTKRAS